MPAVALLSIDGFSAALAADPLLRLPALRGLKMPTAERAPSR